LPIANKSEFLGLISDRDIYDNNIADDPIGNHELSLDHSYVTSDQHVYEIIELASKQKLTIIPVLDDQKNYLGVITIADLMHYFADLSAFKNPGAIIILSLTMKDYSLSEIAQIVESNDVKILSLYVSQPDESMEIDVTLKLNTTDISAIIQTFNRYDYTIKATFMEDSQLEDLFNARYEEFMKYLDM